MNTQPATPIVPVEDTRQLHDRVHLIPDNRVEFVPNIGIVAGDDAVLVIDCGMGPRNGERVLERAKEIAGDRPLLLTLTHFHPEHGFAAQSFKGEAVLLYNRLQHEELKERGKPYIDMFSTFGDHLAELLAEVELVDPQVVYDGDAQLDLGGVRVELREVAGGHTRGDQVVWLPELRMLFAGDLAEDRFFPILPEPDCGGSRWIEVLDELEALGPETVVGGHGDVGDVEIIRAARGYLADVRDRVRAAGDRDLDELKTELESHYVERYPDWDNVMWIGSAVEAFRREA